VKTLVTGGAGFIGSAVVRQLLARRRDVRVMLAPKEPDDNVRGLEVELVRADLLDRDSVARAVAGCDVVYHLAAIYSLWLPDESLIYRVNVEGTKHVLAAARDAGVRKIVHTSSIAAVGVPDEGQLADEQFRFNHWDGGNAYIRSKYLSDLDAQRFAADGVPVVIVCPGFPFGERDRGPTPTGRFIVEALLKISGNESCTRHESICGFVQRCRCYRRACIDSGRSFPAIRCFGRAACRLCFGPERPR
jgi:dihydroflavonol-4-reductase